MTKIKIVLIGTNEEFGRSLEDFCAFHPKVEFLAHQTELESALNFVGEVCPDLVFIDFRMKVRSRQTLLGATRARCAATKFCWLSVFDEKIYAKHAHELGFDGAISGIDFPRQIDSLLEALFPDHSVPASNAPDQENTDLNRPDLDKRDPAKSVTDARDLNKPDSHQRRVHPSDTASTDADKIDSRLTDIDRSDPDSNPDSES